VYIAQFRLKTLAQRLLCQGREILDFASDHPLREMRQRAVREAADYIERNMADAVGVYTQRELLDIALRQIGLEGHILEFGVYRGGSIRFIAKRQQDRKIHGFDSFEGLPESWAGWNLVKGDFSLHGKLPKVPVNVKLHPGWFEDTLPRWLDAEAGAVAFIHIDCDVYSSTKTVLAGLARRIKPGTIIVFDEYFGYPNWQEHEYRAFREYTAEFGANYTYIGWARTQVAVKITAVASGEGLHESHK
jgi:predicted O-methyltransferase YrrM